MPLILLAAVANALESAKHSSHMSNGQLMGSIIISLVVALLFGWLLFFIFALTLEWSGYWIGGKADSNTLLKVIAYAHIPIIIGITISIVQLSLWGTTRFSYDSIILLDIPNRLLAIGLFSVEFILSLWTFVLCIIGIAKAQEFSYIRATVNFIMGICFMLLPLLIFLLLYTVL